MPWPHEREHYRVTYPSSLRPRLTIQGHSFDVLDLSERGLRFRLGDVPAPAPGNDLEGTVRFRRGEALTVRGTVLRVIDHDVSVRLEEGIPVRVIMEEQRFLLHRHRHLGT